MPLKGINIRKPDFRSYFSGLLPLFTLAHFGHHVVGAMLRPLMPMIRTELGLSYTEAGIVISAFAITGGISQLPAGWLADRLGPRLMVLLGVAGVAATGLMIGRSQSYLALIIFLVLAAVLGGGYHPASASAISALVSAERRGRALGIHLIGGSSCFWVVPLLAAPIAAALGWRSPYIILSIPAIMLGVVLYILIGRRSQSRDNNQITIDIGVTGTRKQIPWRQLVPFIVLSVVTGTMIQSVSAYLSLYAVDHLHIAEQTAAMLMAISPAVGLFAAPMGGYLADRFGGVPVLVITSILAVPLVYMLGLATNVFALVGIMIVIGIVSFTRMPTSEAYIVGHTPQHRRSTILGFYFFAGAEVSGLLTPVIGNLIDRFGFYRTFTIASVTLAAATATCLLLLWRNRTLTVGYR